MTWTFPGIPRKQSKPQNLLFNAAMLLKSSIGSRLTGVLAFNVRSIHATRIAASYPVSKNGKPLTPYIRFTTEKREEVLKAQPNLTVPEVGRRLGELWRGLSESERERYKTEYERAKEAK